MKTQKTNLRRLLFCLVFLLLFSTLTDATSTNSVKYPFVMKNTFKSVWNAILDLNNRVTDLFKITSNLQNQIGNLTLTPGPQGPPGKDGEEGPQGIQGPQGPPGLPGTSSSCAWKLSHKKSENNSGFPWISLEEMRDLKATGNCHCGDGNSTDIQQILITGTGSGYLRQNGGAGFPDNRVNCFGGVTGWCSTGDNYPDYFVYLACP